MWLAFVPLSLILIAEAVRPEHDDDDSFAPYNVYLNVPPAPPTGLQGVLPDNVDPGRVLTIVEKAMEGHNQRKEEISSEKFDTCVRDQIPELHMMQCMENMRGMRDKKSPAEIQEACQILAQSASNPDLQSSIAQFQKTSDAKVHMDAALEENAPALFTDCFDQVRTGNYLADSSGLLQTAELQNSTHLVAEKMGGVSLKSIVANVVLAPVWAVVSCGQVIKILMGQDELSKQKPTWTFANAQDDLDRALAAVELAALNVQKWLRVRYFAICGVSIGVGVWVR